VVGDGAYILIGIGRIIWLGMGVECDWDWAYNVVGNGRIMWLGLGVECDWDWA